MCTTIVKKIDDSSKSAQFVIKNIAEGELPENVTKDQVEKEMHVVGSDGRVYKNAEAILKILEQYPTWSHIVWIGRLPVIRHVLPIGYRFIAMNRHFLYGSIGRIYWTKVVICIGFIASVLLSLKLWVNTRFYPHTPILEIIPPFPYPFDWIILIGILCLLVATIFVPKPKFYIWATVFLTIILVIYDQSRLQPWVYQYVWMLVTLALFSWKFEDSDGRKATLNACRFIIATIYFWSGIQKLNPEFINSVFPWMVGPIVQLFPDTTQSTFYAFGMFVPFIEIGIGIGLLTRFKNIGIGFAFAMCIFVLWTLGPFGHNWNSVVWPWNITLLALVCILFIKTDIPPIYKILNIKKYVFHRVVLVVFGFLPMLYFFNVWDSYLSWSLYSGTTNQSTLYISDSVKERLPKDMQQFVQTDTESKSSISILDWSFTELNVPPYPETRIFKNIAQNVCKYADNPNNVVLDMRGRVSWFYRDAQQSLNCAQL